MLETGICLVWVPRPELIRKLIDSDGDAERESVLIGHEAEVLEDVGAALALATHTELGASPAVAREALGAYEAGCRRASQTLSGSLLTAVLDENFGQRNFADARTRFQRDHPDYVGMSVFRLAAVQQSIANAITPTRENPPGFNRHATAHSIATTQFTDANALTALMLLAGVLRELHEAYLSLDRQEQGEGEP